MQINRRILMGSALALAAAPALASPSDEETVKANVEAHRAAMLAGNAETLDRLCTPELSYSHSDGHIEDKATYIANALKTKYLSLEYRNPTVRVVGSAAIVRFHWVGKSTEANGKTGDTSLAVLMVWQKQHGQWRLLARGSCKV